MESFFYISQKIMNPQIDPYVYDDNFDKKLKFGEILRENKKQHEDTATYNFFYNYVMHSKRNVQKFEFLRSIIENAFCSDEFKEKILTLFCKIQKTNTAFSRLSFIYKYKKASIKINTDVFLNPIKLGDKNIICIFDKNNSCKYLFMINDIIQIIKKSLTNSPYFFSHPLESKNPYTNIPFNKSTLYNIYFFIKEKYYIVPELIQNFFYKNFDLEEFCKNNTYVIREYVIKDFIDNISPEEAEIYIFSMVEKYYKKKTYIDIDFPKNKLLEIMRPYLQYYFIATYSLCMGKRHEYFHKLEEKLQRFFKFNKKFGRRYFKLKTIPKNASTNPFDPMNKIKKKVIMFDDSHINFHEKKNVSFLTSHIRRENDIYEEEVVHEVNMHINMNDAEEDEEDEEEYDEEEDYDLEVNSLLERANQMRNAARALEIYHDENSETDSLS